MKNFDNYMFRASQMHLLTTGTIGVTEVQDKRIDELINERDTGLNGNGNKCKWTDNKEKELEKLIYKKENLELPKTMRNELRKIHRSEKYNRTFPFTNRYLQKGIAQEEEAITNLYEYLTKVLKEKVFFKKNDVRLYNDFFQGEPDINPFVFKGKKCGFDTKCSWSLDTFPYPEDDLDDVYEYQNQTYMSLTGSEMWITAYVLVNCTEQGLFNEKQKHFYALGMPGDVEHKNWDEYIRMCKELEKMLIFDYDRFVSLNPYHHLEHSREEWMKEDLNIPLEDRVLLKESYLDLDKINEMRDRVIIARDYLIQLDN